MQILPEALPPIGLGVWIHLTLPQIPGDAQLSDTPGTEMQIPLFESFTARWTPFSHSLEAAAFPPVVESGAPPLTDPP